MTARCATALCGMLVLALALVLSGAGEVSPAGAASGPCPMAGSCTVKSAGGLYLTWRQSSAVYLATKISAPGALWNLGYGGFEIKVGTVGRTLCLAAVRPHVGAPRSRLEVSHCAERRWQQWTMAGTRTFGRHIEFRSVASETMCLTAEQKKKKAVLERCATGGKKAAAQTWST